MALLSIGNTDKRFQDMSEDSIANLTLQDYEKYEEQRMEKNA